MKKGIIRSLILVLGLSLLLVACKNNSDKTQKINRLTNGDVLDEVVTLRLLVIETGTKWNTYPEHAVALEIAKKVGVKIEFVEVDDRKFNELLAGGDLPDIVRTEPAKYAKQLIAGDLIIPMDDMIDVYGQDILQNIPSLIDYSKKNWSEGRNQLYFLSPQVQAEASSVYPSLTIGPTIRWDYYKEIGAPSINDPEDMLDVLEQIVANHPETDDGKKIYGVSMWQDWGLWPYIFPFTWYTMQSADNSDLMVNELGQTQYQNILTDQNSTYWLAMNFYNEANRRGLLDPEALTMKYNDYLARATSGQIVLGPATWAMGDFNAMYAKDGKGYVVLPIGKRAWSGGINPLGWLGKSYAISRSSEHPEKAMEFLNYLYSYEGARTLYSGVEGVHWNMVEGKPQIKDETFTLKITGGTEWENTGIGMDLNLIGLGGSVVDRSTGAPLDLFMTPEALVRGNTELEQDFSEYYGGLYPGDVLSKLIEDGKLVDSNSPSKYMTHEQRTKEGLIGLTAIPEAMLKIEAEVKKLAAQYAVRLILASTDEEFEVIKQDALDAFDAANVDEFTEFYTNKYAENREKIGAIPASRESYLE